MMKVMITKARFLWGLTIGFALLLLVPGCGDDSSVSVEGGGTGFAMILMHDAPVDSLKEVWLTVSSLRLIGGDSDSAAVTVLDEPLRIDFLALDSVSRIISLAEMEAQSFSKIRLEVSDPEFLDKHDSTITADDIQLVANGKVDLNFQGPVVVPADELTVISIDLDVENSVQVNQTGNGKYILLPQIKLDPSVEPGTDVEVEEAVIVSVDVAAGSLVVESPGSPSPLTIKTGTATEFKDAAGDPIQLGDLTPGTTVEIEGHIDPDSGVIMATEIKIVA